MLRVPEKQQDAVTAISGSGPAYIFFVVEAMIEAGVHLGLPRSTSTDLVVQTLVGSAKMLKETGEHPTVLRENGSLPLQAQRLLPCVRSTTTRCGLPSSPPWRPHATGHASSPPATDGSPITDEWQRRVRLER